jgi:hypothetical protein
MLADPTVPSAQRVARRHDSPSSTWRVGNRRGPGRTKSHLSVPAASDVVPLARALLGRGPRRELR